ncbi:MAG: glutamate 5-kinase [Gammaproteobacteria bacterium]|jgi:glutamate 5-kinase|nr:glutamate 5-kinase [Gammaproteobacteria bacterium]MBT4494560.1 glutamate 5-kinase [Gammaproteobacteria bacterium]MBT7369732.1 glutamate 5-kinase [Gammaproteobacteria bacterium]
MNDFSAGRTWVIKVGSSLLTNHGEGIDHSLVQGWVDDIAVLLERGIRVVLVSSGAVAEGMQRLGFADRPHSEHVLQAVAAVGQMSLIQIYESAFQQHSLHTAQILLTHDDLRSRQRYLNARNTLKQLLDLGVVPVVNENDTVVTDEIRFGDNDTLAALVANLIEAETLLLLTDQRGLMSANPAEVSDAELIREMPASERKLDGMAGEGSAFGRGGMKTKVNAARIAARSGASTIIASGRKEHVIGALADGHVDGTLLTADREAIVARKQWLATLPVRGKLTLDGGACRVLKKEGRSLLSVGVVQSSGSYTRGDLVVCVDEAGLEIGRGLSNYGSLDVQKLCRVSSDRIESILGFVAEEELIHRDNFILA